MHQAPCSPQPKFCSNVCFPFVSQTVVRPSFSCVSQVVNWFCLEAQALLATGRDHGTGRDHAECLLQLCFPAACLPLLSHHSPATVPHLSSHVSCLKASALASFLFRATHSAFYLTSSRPLSRYHLTFSDPPPRSKPQFPRYFSDLFCLLPLSVAWLLTSLSPLL